MADGDDGNQAVRKSVEDGQVVRTRIHSEQEVLSRGEPASHGAVAHTDGQRTNSLRAIRQELPHPFEASRKDGPPPFGVESNDEEFNGVTMLLRLVLALSLVIPASAGAHGQSLSSEAIREAYFLGRRRDRTTGEFLAKYVRTFPTPKTGPHIARVEVVTPYVQIVLAAKDRMLNAGVIDAEHEYRAHPAVFLVRIRCYSTITSTLPSEGKDLGRVFSIRVVQGHLLKPQKEVWSYFEEWRGQKSGADGETVFDAAEIESAPMTIEVSYLDGQSVEATFDLDKLK